ncbi:MAG: hypothetical protein IPM79_22500 [Polyangiaceae bacterium]|nr:hypothetical protein [Polyangiaceae bacterium]
MAAKTLEDFAECFLEPVRRVERRQEELRVAPTTVLGDMEREIVTNLRRFSPEQIGEASLSALRAIPTSAFEGPQSNAARELRRVRSGIRAKRGGSTILELIRRAHLRTPYAPLLLLASPSVARRRFEAVCLIEGMLQKAGRVQGERRVRALMPALVKVAEALHRPFLEAIQRLNNYAAGIPVWRRAEYGQLVQDLAPKFPDLADPSASRVRNAVVHETSDYQPSSESVVFRGKNRWRCEKSISEIERDVWQTLTLAGGTLWSAPGVYAIEVFMKATLPAVKDVRAAALVGDPSAIQRELQKLETAHAPIMAAVAELRAKAGDAFPFDDEAA